MDNYNNCSMHKYIKNIFVIIKKNMELIKIIKQNLVVNVSFKDSVYADLRSYSCGDGL